MKKIFNKKIILGIFAFIILVPIIWGLWYAQRFEDLVRRTNELTLNRKEWQFPSRIWSDFRQYNIGDRVDSWRLKQELKLHKYPSSVLRFNKNGFTLKTEKRSYPDGFQQVEKISVFLDRKNTIRKIIDLENQDSLSSFRLKPIQIGHFIDHHLIFREYIAIENVSQYFIDAVVSAEDRHFYRHTGINPLSMFRASRKNFSKGDIIQGGSTITQQVVKNLYLDNSRTYYRKFKEAIGSFYIEWSLEKTEILEWYVNLVYFGFDFPYNICGISDASRHFYGKQPSQLNIQESALLAGIIPAPSYFDPFNHPDRAKKRRNHILKAMHSEGYINDSLYAFAKDSPIVLNNLPEKQESYRYFREAVLRFAAENFADSSLYYNSSDVYTSLSPYLQNEAQNSLKKGVAHIDSLWGSDNAQGAIVTIDNRDYRMKAVVGGRSEDKDLFNRALQAYRQPGSSFKIFVYLAAMDAPLSSDSLLLTPSTILPDTPSVFYFTDSLDSIWEPKNYGGEYLGLATIRRAMERSQNVATSYLTMQLTPKRIAEYAYKTGISTDVGEKPSLGLGASEITPYEITRAMTTIANYGRRSKVTPIRYISDKNGDITYEPEVSQIVEVDSTSTFLLLHLLDGVVRYGRSYDVRMLGFMNPSCGKTGTSNDYKDAWYVGFTRQYSTSVWIGYDNARSFGLTGTKAAIPVWTDFNIKSHLGERSLEFPVPSGLTELWVCHHSGMLPTAHCPLQTKEFFLPSTEPNKACTWHINSLIDSMGVFLGEEINEKDSL